MSIFLCFTLLVSSTLGASIWGGFCNYSTAVPGANGCLPGLTCSSNNTCTGTLGQFNSPCNTYTCYGPYTNTDCMASSECNNNYYCMVASSALYCIAAQGQVTTSGYGLQGYPCVNDGTCDTRYYCETNATVYGTYGQPVCLIRATNIPGYCKVHNDCYLQGSRCCNTNYNAFCARGSCDLVMQWCQTVSSPIQNFWYNGNCYPQGVTGPQGTKCTSTNCSCGM